MIKTHAIAALVGLLVGLAAMWWIMDGRVDAANARTELQRQRVANAQADLASCTAASEIQNQAIEALRQRARDAEAAFEQAGRARSDHDAQADTILQERVPEGANVCEAARDAFAEELRRERAK